MHFKGISKSIGAPAHRDAGHSSMDNGARGAQGLVQRDTGRIVWTPRVRQIHKSRAKPVVEAQ